MGKDKKKKKSKERSALEEMYSLQQDFQEKMAKLQAKIRKEEEKRKPTKAARQPTKAARQPTQAARQPARQDESTPKAARRSGSTSTPETPGSSHSGQRLGQWTKEAVIMAWNAHQGGMSITKSAKKYGVPVTTCKDKFRRIKEKLAQGEKLEDLMGLMGHCSGGKQIPRIFTESEESLLCQHLLRLADGGFGLTCHELREVAHQWGLERGCNVEVDASMLSYNWFYSFMDRHPELKVTKPQELSLYRALAPSEIGIEKWFECYSGLVHKYKISDGVQIWNIDETGVMDQPKAQKVIMGFHHPKVQVVAGERGQITTVLSFASATGLQCPPTIIMKGASVQQTWREFLPQDWHLCCSHNGWINKRIFLSTGRKFLKFLEERGLLGRRHIVLLDGHSSHSYNYSFCLLMAAHNVTVVQFPAHCTHFLQPYDSCILSLLKKNWQDAMRVWNRIHAGARISKSAFFIPFHSAWRKTMKPTIIQAAFRRTGMWPLNQHRVSDAWFKARESLGEIGHHHLVLSLC